MSKKIALLGQPNSGKSTVFNALTGSRQHVGNWPGKTVEKKDGTYTWQGEAYTVSDLPGSYGLTGNSDEEIITTNFIRSRQADLTVVLVDASQLERSMFMLAEFSVLKAPAILLLNMMDIAKSQNKEINAELLADHLGIPVLPFVAADGKEYEKLKTLIAKEISQPHMLSSAPAIAQYSSAGSSEARDAAALLAENEAKYAWISEMLQGVTKTADPDYKLSKFDRLVTRPVLGKVITILIILLAFVVAMIVFIPFSIIGKCIPMFLSGPIDAFLTGMNVNSWLVSIFSIMLPNVLYFALAMAGFVFGVNVVFGYLEEVGFIARAAYQFDGVLSKLGLQGKAICPILMGFGCTIGGSSATRVMDNWGQRMLAMAVVWAVPCSAIWAVIPVVGSMFFPGGTVLLICLLIIAYMFFVMWLVSKIFAKKLIPESAQGGMIMELPPYHKAHWKHIFKEAFFKGWDIFKRALRTVTLISLIFWALSFSSTGNVADSLLYKIGTAIEPVTRIFGLGWQTFLAFLSGAFAKEAVLGVLNAAFVGQNSLVSATFNSKFLTVDAAPLAAAITSAISPAEALAFMFASTFNIPCVMALGTTYRESHSLKWTALIAGFYVGSALILSFIVYHIAVLFLH